MLRRTLLYRHRTGKSRAFVYHDPSLRILRAGSGFQQLKRMGMPAQRTGGFRKVDSFFANNQYQHAWPLLTHDDLGNSDQSNNTNNIMYSMYMPKRNKGTAPWFRGADTYSVKYCEQGRYEYQRYLMINRFPSEYRKHFVRFLRNIRAGAASTALPQETLHWLLRMIVDNFNPQHVHYIAAMATLQSCNELDMARDVWKVMERQHTWPDSLTLCAYLDVCVAAGEKSWAMEAWNRYGSELHFLRCGEVDPKPITRVPFSLNREELLYLPKWKKHFDHDPNLDVPDRNRFNRTREVYLRMAKVMLAADDKPLWDHFYHTLLRAMLDTPTPVPEPPNPHLVHRPRWRPYEHLPSVHSSPWRVSNNGRAMALGPSTVAEREDALQSRFLTNEQFIVHSVAEMLAVRLERWHALQLRRGGCAVGVMGARRAARLWECLGEHEEFVHNRFLAGDATLTGHDGNDRFSAEKNDGPVGNADDTTSGTEGSKSNSIGSSNSEKQQSDIEDYRNNHITDSNTHSSNQDENSEAAEALVFCTHLVDDAFARLSARRSLADMSLGTLIARVLAIHRTIGREGGSALHARAHALCRRTVGSHEGSSHARAAEDRHGENARRSGRTQQTGQEDSTSSSDDANHSRSDVKEDASLGSEAQRADGTSRALQTAPPALTAHVYLEILRGFADESAFVFDRRHNTASYRPGFDAQATMRGLTTVLHEMAHLVHVAWSADMHLEVIRTLVGCGTMAANEYFVQNVLRQFRWTSDFLEPLYLEYRRHPCVDMWSELTKRALVWTARYDVAVSERVRRLIEDDYALIHVHTRSFRELAVFQFRHAEEKRYGQQVVNELPNPWIDYVSHALPFPDRDAGYPDEYGDIGQWRAPGGPGSPVRGPGYYAPPMEGEHLRGYTAEWRDLKNPMKPPAFPVPWERKYRQYARGQHPSYDMTYAGPMPEIFPGRHNFRKPTRWDYHDIEKQGKFKISGPY